MELPQMLIQDIPHSAEDERNMQIPQTLFYVLKYYHDNSAQDHSLPLLGN